jgi:hypothetical protein
MASEAARQKYPDDYETEPGEVIWNFVDPLREAYDAGRVDALREAADGFDARLSDGTGNGRAYNSYTVARMLSNDADRIEKEALPECGDYPAPCNHDPAHVKPGAESLPPDPEPMVGLESGARHRQYTTCETGLCEFDPRPGYEQRREFYEKGAE